METEQHINRECGDEHHTTCPGIVYSVPGGYMHCECKCHQRKKTKKER